MTETKIKGFTVRTSPEVPENEIWIAATCPQCGVVTGGDAGHFCSLKAIEEFTKRNSPAPLVVPELEELLDELVIATQWATNWDEGALDLCPYADHEAATGAMIDARQSVIQWVAEKVLTKEEARDTVYAIEQLKDWNVPDPFMKDLQSSHEKLKRISSGNS